MAHRFARRIARPCVDLVADPERRDLRPPVHRPQIRGVAIDGEVLTAEPGVTINIDARPPEHANRRNAIVPTVGAVQILFFLAGIPALGAPRIVGPFVDADPIARRATILVVIAASAITGEATSAPAAVHRDPERVDSIVPRAAAVHVAQGQVRHVAVEFVRGAEELAVVEHNDPGAPEDAQRGNLVAPIAEIRELIAGAIAPRVSLVLDVLVETHAVVVA